MRLCIAQPAYLPWLGLIERIGMCDLAVLLDHVEMDHASRTKFANRNKVRTAQGWTWLTVPVRTRDERGELPLHDVEIVDDGRWSAKHWATLRQSYARADGWSEHAAFLEHLYAQRWTRLVPLADATLRWLLDGFGVTTPQIASSQLRSRTRKSQLILDLCVECRADTYVSGPFGRTYLDAAAFERAGVRVEFHDHVAPVYPQLHAGFEPNLSALDLLLTHPRDARLRLRTRDGSSSGPASSSTPTSTPMPTQGAEARAA